jgi:hypothetical protein
MFGLFEEGRPDERALARKFGVRPPAMFVRFAQWVFDRDGGDVKAAARLYYDLTGHGAESLNMLYPGTPMELFAIGGSGGDGSHAGFAVLAPERATDDHPWMDYTPAGHVLDFIAPDTPTFFAQLLSYVVAEDDIDPEIKDAGSDVASWLGVNVSAEAGRHRGFLGKLNYWEIGAAKPTFEPSSVPPGWKYEAVANDVGVLAPTIKFAPTFSEAILRERNLDVLYVEVDRLLKSGAPASALRLLRSPLALWESHGSEQHYGLLVSKTKEAYEALDRPVLAARVGTDV